MKIRWQLTLLFGILFLILAGLVFILFKSKPISLIIGELGLIVLLIVFVWLLGKITKPLDQIALGVDALKDQDFSGTMLKSGSKEIDRLVTVYNQMIGNIKKERVFQQEQHFFLQNLIESLPVGLIILDFDQKLKEFNPIARDILNIHETDKGQELSKTSMLLHEEILIQEIRHPQTYKISGTRYIRVFVDRFKHRGFYQKFVIVEEAGDEILKVEKQSYGKVIRMMAHEVKNSVGAINSILESLSIAQEMTSHDRNEYLGIVLDRNSRLNNFVENFAKVVRLPLPEMTEFNLAATVESVYHLIKLKFKNKPVHFTLEISRDTVMVKGSQEQIEQVLINVVLNAFESIEHIGRVDIKLSDNKLQVIDNGSGITEEVKSKLFTPFFSTKPTGQGVGLTMTREILHNHGFSFSLKSLNGETNFEVVFKQM